MSCFQVNGLTASDKRINEKHGKRYFEKNIQEKQQENIKKKNRNQKYF